MYNDEESEINKGPLHGEVYNSQYVKEKSYNTSPYDGVYNSAYVKEKSYDTSPYSGVYTGKAMTTGYAFTENDLAEIKKQEEYQELVRRFEKGQKERKEAEEKASRPALLQLRDLLGKTAYYLQNKPETREVGLKVGHAINALDKGDFSYLPEVYSELLKISPDYARPIEDYKQLAAEAEVLFHHANKDSYEIKKEEYKKQSFFSRMKDKLSSLRGNR